MFTSQFEELTWAIIILRLSLSLVSGILIGLERKFRNHPAGMKTHAIVCIGSALASLLSIEMFYTFYNGGFEGDIKLDMARIAAGVLTGIGFVGAGAIMKSSDGLFVTGLTTAATLWVTACLGLTIGMGYLKISVVALVTIFIANVPLRRLELKLNFNANCVKSILITTKDKSLTMDFMKKLLDYHEIKIENFELVKAEYVSGSEDNVFALKYTIKLNNHVKFESLLQEISLDDNSLQVVESVSM